MSITEKRNHDLYRYLTTPDADGYHPSYQNAADRFKISPQHVSRTFYRECERHLEAGEELPEFHVRNGRPPDTPEDFLRKRGHLIEEMRLGTSVRDLSAEYRLSETSLYRIRQQAVELGLLTVPRKEQRMKKHSLPVSTLRNDAEVEAALNTPAAKHSLNDFLQRMGAWARGSQEEDTRGETAPGRRH